MASSLSLSKPAPRQRSLFPFLLHEMLPKGKIFTIFNVVSVAIMALAA